MIEILAQITSRGTPKRQGFCAGIILWDDVVIEAAPILRFMAKQKYTRSQAREYCEKRGWKVEIIHQLERAAPSPQYYARKKRR